MKIHKILCATIALITSACQTTSKSDSELESLKDTVSIVQQSNGNFRVTCRNGSQEDVTEAQILANAVCGGPATLISETKCVRQHPSGECQVRENTLRYGSISCTDTCKKFYSSGDCQVRSTCEFDETLPGFKAKECESFYSSGDCAYWQTKLITREFECGNTCARKYPNGECQVVNTCSYSRDTRVITRKTCTSFYSSGDCQVWEDTTVQPGGVSCTNECQRKYSSGDCQVRSSCQWIPEARCFKKKTCGGFFSSGDCQFWNESNICAP